MRRETFDKLTLAFERKSLLALLHVRVSQLTWTQTSTPMEDIAEGIERARCTGPDSRLSPAPPAWPLRFVYRPC